MSLDYFYCPKKNISGNIVTIEDDEFSHLTHVMRKREGDMIRVIDGEGMAYDVMLVNIKKKIAEGTITARYPNHNEAQCSVTLAVGILKNPSRFDFLIEKVTELGVREIIPLRTERTVPSSAKVERWQKIALSAMKQSCRSFLPHVAELSTLESLIARMNNFERQIVFHEKAKEGFSNMNQQNKNDSSILLVVGPEGGFSEDEINCLTESGFTSVNLGERRLRTETAAIVVASMFLTRQ